MVKANSKKLYVVLGAGGTGSYFLGSLIPYLKSQLSSENYNTPTKKERSVYDYSKLQDLQNIDVEHVVHLFDGDVLEEKNLLRQGFFRGYINVNKAEALLSMYQDDIENTGNMNLTIHPKYLQEVEQVTELVSENLEGLTDVILVSCVDNNLARLRLIVAQQIIKSEFPNLKVVFFDSGNEEWFGQVLVSSLDIEDKPALSIQNEKITYSATDFSKLHNIFLSNTDWKNKLTKGDHELSCDVIAESSPQNIATNMTASSLLIKALDNHLKGLTPVNYSFESDTNLIKELGTVDLGFMPQLFSEIADYCNDVETKDTLFSVSLESLMIKKTTTKETVTEEVVTTVDVQPLEENKDFTLNEQAETPIEVITINTDTPTPVVEVVQESTPVEEVTISETVEEVVQEPTPVETPQLELDYSGIDLDF